MHSQVRIEHIAIAVADLEAAISNFTSILGLPVSGRETVESEQVKVAFFDLGTARIELLEPTTDESPVGKFLDRHGPGLHHIALDVDDIDSALDRCRAAGIETVGAAPRSGAGGRRVAFLHPGTTGGTLLELSQRP